MRKIFQILIITSMFISMSFMATGANISAEEEKYDSFLKDLSKSQSVIQLTYDETITEKPIMPLSEAITIPITISYKLVGVFAQSTASYCNRKGITQIVTLSIEDIPKWCTATIEPYQINVDISDNFRYVETNIIVAITEEAPAFKPFTIAIKVSTPQINGPFGIMELISGSEVTQIVALKPDFIPIFSVYTDATYLKIDPVNTTKIPIIITNFGNGKTEYILEVKDLPNNWNISFPESIILEPGTEKEVILEVKPYKYFENRTIELNVKAQYYAETGSTGRIYTIRFTLINDGSYKEEDDFLSQIIIPSIVIFIILIIAILLFKKIKGK